MTLAPAGGYVTRFHVRVAYLSRYEVQTVGSHLHQEYWIPADDLDDFNRNIVGPIEVVAAFGETHEPIPPRLRHPVK